MATLSPSNIFPNASERMPKASSDSVVIPKATTPAIAPPNKTIVLMNDDRQSLASVLRLASPSKACREVSCQTATTVDADASSLSDDDEDEHLAATAQTTRVVETPAPSESNEEDQPQADYSEDTPLEGDAMGASTTPSTSRTSSTSCTPEESPSEASGSHSEEVNTESERAMHEEEESLTSHTTVTEEEEEYLTESSDEGDSNSLPRSILKPCDMAIPIQNKGWKNLPKLTSATLPPAPTTNTRTPPTQSSRRQVVFQSVCIRCYDQCIGDNPAVSYGTPISLDWTYDEMDALDLDTYEATRGKRRNPRQMMMNYFNRRHLLTLSGASETELVRAEKAANKVRSQRSRTKALLPASGVEDLFGSVMRKTKRAMKGGKTSKSGGAGKASNVGRRSDRTPVAPQRSPELAA